MSEPGIRSPEEDDPEYALRIQQQRYAQRVQQRLQEERDVSGTIENHYRDAWSDFYSREPEQSEQLIRSLEVVSPHPPLSLDDLFEDAENDQLSLDPTPSEASFVSWPDLQQHSEFSADIALTLPSKLSEYAYRKYESCTPSVEGILYDGDPRILKFIPCADDPDFEAELYASNHLQLAWQTEWFDVDFKLIAADALLRLEDTELDHEKIGRFKPRSLPSPASGFMAFLRKRDLLHWSSKALVQRHGSTPMLTTTTHVLSEVNSLISVFCGSLLCNKAKCMTHDAVPPPVILDHPTKSNADMHANGRVKCGDNCFLKYSYAPLLAEPSVDQDIYDLLKQFPNYSPCKLAELAKTTCYSVFHHRCHMFPDGQTNTPNAQDDAHIDMSLDFCVHSGPCKANTKCACTMSKRECQRRCRCPKSCPLRHMGCKCEKHESHTDMYCSCLEHEEGTQRKWNKECDPEYCKMWRTKGKNSKRQKHKCKNMRFHLNKVPHLSVKMGSYGLGTFAESFIPKGAFLGEYIAEMIPNPENDEGGIELDHAQGMLNTHRNLNYFFDLPIDTHLLDAATVGNTLRYINCPKSQSLANVEADDREVGGDVKVVFFSTKAIQCGQELMLWYGEHYWDRKGDVDTV